MAKSKPGDTSSESDDAEFSEYVDDKYANVSSNIKTELQKADKQKGEKAPGVTDP